MTKRWVRLTLTIVSILLVTALAWTLRWRAVNILPPDYDEDDYLRAAQQYAALIRSGNWVGFLNTNYRAEHPPLAKIVFGFSILPAPVSPLLPDLSTIASPSTNLPKAQMRDARTSAAIFGTLEVALLALVSPLGGFFLAIHTFTIKYTSQIMLEALPAFLSLLSILCYIREKKKGTLKDGKLISLWLTASAIFLGLTAASKYLYCVVGIAILVDWFIEVKRNRKLVRFIKQAAIWGVLALLVFFVSDPYLWPAPFTRLKESVLNLSGYAISAPEVQQANFPFWQPFVWLTQSVPWHPGVFLVSLDLFITILAFIGLKQLWRRERVYVLWLGIAMFFLLLWPTKWPQYILVLTAPLSLAAAEGLRVGVTDPLAEWWMDRGSRRRSAESNQHNQRETRRAIPWLAPGVITLILLAIFPLLFQLAMALTDFTRTSIKDGITGGVWRAVWLGLTGQAKLVDFNPFGPGVYSSQTVHFAGFRLLGQLFSGIGNGILVFSLFWMVSSVLLQSALGISVAVMLNRRGVRFAGFWRTLFILPWAIPEFIGALIWMRTFQPQIGWFGMLLPQGVPLPASFDNTGYAFIVLLIAATWYGFPFIMLAASAGLKLVPGEVYEAAAIDGAHGWAVFSNVTWPLLLPLLIPAIIIRAIFAFNQFYLFYVMQTNFPLLTFSTISYYIFYNGGQYAASAAINVFTVVALIASLLWFNRLSKAAQGVTYA
jgi:ABC-type sugar transport system permease subunit